jgi:hypothetical protein
MGSLDFGRCGEKSKARRGITQRLQGSLLANYYFKETNLWTFSSLFHSQF